MFFLSQPQTPKSSSWMKEALMSLRQVGSLSGHICKASGYLFAAMQGGLLFTWMGKEQNLRTETVCQNYISIKKNKKKTQQRYNMVFLFSTKHTKRLLLLL